jgi:chromate reductase, NAD(P)H dehydrogenase (quinone)
MTTILAVPGALRHASRNLGLARAAAELAPPGVTVDVHRLTDVPLFDEDVEAAGLPDGVVALREAVARADALLVCSPEYNAGIPGVLKNALDWLSRPPRPKPLEGLAASVLGASPGRFGTARAQIQVRLVLQNTGARVMPQPELFVSGAGTLFDDDGTLTDDATRERLAAHVAALAAWAGMTAGAGA